MSLAQLGLQDVTAERAQLGEWFRERIVVLDTGDPN